MTRTAIDHRRPVVLVVGTPRSGTTVVYERVAALAGATPVPETHFLAHLHRTAPGLLVECVRSRRWDVASRRRAFVDAYLAHCRALDLIDAADLDRLTDERATIEGCGLFDALLGVVDLIAGGSDPILAEKTPDHLPWLDTLCRSAASDDRRLIGLVARRPPHSVIASQVRTFGMPEQHARRRVRADQRIVDRLTKRWASTVTVIDVSGGPDQLDAAISAALSRNDIDVVADATPTGARAVRTARPWESWKLSADTSAQVTYELPRLSWLRPHLRRPGVWLASRYWGLA